MRLFRHGPIGQEKPGALDAHGGLRDLSALLPDLTPDWLSDERLAALRSVELERLPLLDPGVRIAEPVAGVRQFVAIGLNYRAHALEAGLEIPAEPVVFFKAVSSIAGPNDPVELPEASTASDWEVELAVVIGRRASRVPAEQALEHVAGYCLANDLSERDWQLHRGGQWSKGKSFPGFGPLGPWLVTRDELPDPQALTLQLSVNGVSRQHSSTADMIFPVAGIVAYLSRFMTLLPGDVILTGTPSGVGLGHKPPEFLRPGDRMRLDGGILGTQAQLVR
ncbi:MAG: hypothetical protein RJA36_2777 [Pseudomonadota bacterium]|jgi:2-keto-4-pentenoate hydratase/2-oxohepta-3-ene-1,7-dioic acid hydratase in catechol pathway